MKPIFALLFFLCFLATASAQKTIYQQSITGLDGFEYSLSSYKGLKIWIIVLPGDETLRGSGFLLRVDSIAAANAGRLATIVIPSLEDGYVEGVKAAALLRWYKKNLYSSIIISRPLLTRKQSKFRQSGLYRWLTSSELNSRYDAEVRGSGSMYFIDEQGSLIGAFGPEAMFSDKVIRLVLK